MDPATMLILAAGYPALGFSRSVELCPSPYTKGLRDCAGVGAGLQ